MNHNEIQKEILKDDDIGNFSDGYHTFNELYHHRALLFANICNLNPHISWKSKKHHVGGSEMYDGMFIVGINTPTGQATYHYDIDPYWDIFNVDELDNAHEWDGHTPNDAINRILEMTNVEVNKYSTSNLVKKYKEKIFEILAISPDHLQSPIVRVVLINYIIYIKNNDGFKIEEILKLKQYADALSSDRETLKETTSSEKLESIILVDNFLTILRKFCINEQFNPHRHDIDFLIYYKNSVLEDKIRTKNHSDMDIKYRWLYTFITREMYECLKRGDDWDIELDKRVKEKERIERKQRIINDKMPKPKLSNKEEIDREIDRQLMEEGNWMALLKRHRSDKNEKPKSFIESFLRR